MCKNIEGDPAKPGLAATEDVQWFLDHPEETERPRLVTFDEALQANVPMGTAVRVMQLPDGTQVRAIQSPPQ